MVQTSTASNAASSDPVLTKLCSKHKPDNCCTFKTTSLDTDGQGRTAIFEDKRLGSCETFLTSGIGQVTVTSTGTDGWRGEFIRIDFSGETANCVVTGWIDDKSSIEFPCETYSTTGMFS